MSVIAASCALAGFWAAQGKLPGMTPKAESSCDDKAPKDVDAQVFTAIERFIGSWRTERNPSENTLRAYRMACILATGSFAAT